MRIAKNGATRLLFLLLFVLVQGFTVSPLRALEAASGEAVPEELPQLFVGNVTVTESLTDDVYATFTVTLSRPSTQPVTVRYATVDGTATEWQDYRPAKGLLRIEPGVTQATVPVECVPDYRDENDQTFFLRLSEARNATISDGEGRAIIKDIDPAPRLLLYANYSEFLEEDGSWPPQPYVFLELSEPSERAITGTLKTIEGSAKAPDDFTPINRTFRFAPGEAVQVVPLHLVNDDLPEGNEYFYISASKNIDGHADEALLPLTILENDTPRPTISIDDVEVFEGDYSVDRARFTLSLSHPVADGVDALCWPRSGTAKVGEDFSNQPMWVTFEPGQKSVTVDVAVFGDVVDEDDETFTLQITGANGATIADGIGVCLIRDDDETYLANAGSSAYESVGYGLYISVELTAPSARTVTLDYRTRNGTALSREDYLPVSGRLVFLPGETSKIVDVPLLDDERNEDRETFDVEFTNPVNVKAEFNRHTITIEDDDALPQLTLSDAVRVEGNSGTQPMEFSAELSAPSGRSVQARYRLVGGRGQSGLAQAGSDYVDVIGGYGTVTFAPGQVRKTIVVPIKGDLVVEPQETFRLELSQVTNAECSDPVATGTISDDDFATTVQFSLAQFRGAEGDKQVRLELTRTGDSVDRQTVRYVVSGGLARHGQDYSVGSGTVKFAPGQRSAVLALPLIDDAIDEDDESFTVRLEALSDSLQVGPQSVARATIVDNDAPPTVSLVGTPIFPEGAAPGGSFQRLTLRLSAVSERNVHLWYRFVAGTASRGYITGPDGDFVGDAGGVTIPAGVREANIYITIKGDYSVEGDEVFYFQLEQGESVAFAERRFPVVIRDDDALTTLAVSQVDIPDPVHIGQMVIYAVTVKNTGTATNNIRIECVTSGAGGTYNHAPRYERAVRPGEERTVGFTLKASAAGTLQNVVKAYSDREHAVPGNAVTSLETTQVFDLLDVTDRYVVVLEGPLESKETTAPALPGANRLRRWKGTIRIVNAESWALSGPLRVVLDDLPKDAEVPARSGLTQRAPAGRPYLNVPLGEWNELAPDAAVTLPVEILASGPQAPNVRLRLLAGPGAP